jgi:hypothetical protein
MQSGSDSGGSSREKSFLSMTLLVVVAEVTRDSLQS